MLRSEEGDRSIVEIAVSFLIIYLFAYFQRRISNFYLRHIKSSDLIVTDRKYEMNLRYSQQNSLY